jgi:hypothetical protein
VAGHRRKTTFDNAMTLYTLIHLDGPITKAEILSFTEWTPGKYATALAFLRDGLDQKGVPINYDAADHTYSIPAAIDWQPTKDYQVRRLRISVKQNERLSKHCIAASKHHPQQSDAFLSVSNQALKVCAHLERILGGWSE